MGWYLLRKPYPGLIEEERVDILREEMLFGRGRECTVHCLSMYVSRRHLKLAPKEDGCVYIMDLGSSNGTFINQSKITAQVQVPLNVGDEVGIGNVNTDNKDCYVYEVCCNDQDRQTELPLQKELVREIEIEKQSKLSPEHHLERGLKRSAIDEPEIVVLEDEDDHNNYKHNEANESVSSSSKRPKLDEQSNSILRASPQREQSIGKQPLHEIKTDFMKCDEPDLFVVEDKMEKSILGVVSKTDCTKQSLTTVAEQENKNLPESNYEHSSHVSENEQNNGIMLPPITPTTLSSKPERHSDEGSFVKPSNRHISALIENSTDTSAGTIKMSSPSSNNQSILSSIICSTPTVSKSFDPEDNKPSLISKENSLTSVACSTPTALKIINTEDIKPVLITSTPCVSKFVGRTCEAGNDGGFSPIVKDSSRHSQESSANYTLEEEMIELSDDDDDKIFPCSQMFAEEDVKPDLQKLDADTNIVDLSLDDEPAIIKGGREDDLDDVVLISSDEDDDEDGIEDAERWFSRLSQSSIIAEVKEEKDDVEEPPGDSGLSAGGEDKFDQGFPDQDGFDFAAEGLEMEDKTREDETKDEEVFEKIRQEELRVQEAKKKLQTMQEERMRLETEAAIRESEVEKIRAKTAKKDKRAKERPKELSSRDSHAKDSQKHSSDRDKSSRRAHKPHHAKHDSKRKDHEDKESTIKKLRDTFGDSSSDLEPEIIPSHQRRFSLHNEKREKSSRVPPDPFDALLNNHSEVELSKSKDQEVHVRLSRLEETHPEWSARNLPSSSSTSSSHQPPKKKGTRKIELVDPLPNPPRRACNRGISESTITKTSSGDKFKKNNDPKPSKTIDPKVLRKEKLAEVAARNASLERGNTEAKRGAPAKIKITASNRGSFLTETDDNSPVNKPKSRREIVGSMKIPKLKDKPATNLPIKSPLQAMNMSWDKVTPEENASSVAPQSVPVEIPTGPQPKKRIAQVPHPGFHNAGNEVPAPAVTSVSSDPGVIPVSAAVAAPNLALQPIKSCLSGSSKHNISLNDSKYVAQKKKVQFKENIVQIRYIEKCTNARPVSSLKDADRPKAKITTMAQAPSTALNNDIIIQDVIYDICKWNPLWLKEEKNLPSDVLPPVVSNMNLPVLPKTEFVDFEEYHKTMYPLLMLELWSSISKEYNSNQGDARSNMFIVDNATTAPVSCKQDRILATLNCHMLVDEKNQNDAPRLGNLVVIDLLLTDPSEKVVVNPVFGYVSFDNKDRLRKQDQFHKDLYNHCRNPVFKVRFSLVIRERKNYKFVFERPMRVKNIKYIRGDLRGFQAMKILNHIPLQYSVISPCAGNEDFTLPDVSSKTLAFPEELNPVQNRIVLQTAEVCQQERPKICLIQGPPGTGKSHVIASLVVQLLYRDGIYSRANRERGLVPRILLCAPSNNAVDLLVRRLLRRRAALPKEYRFKMVRVGQMHIMHPEVKGVSLQELAKSDVVRQDQAANDPNNLRVEITTWAAKLQCIENLITEFTDNNKPLPQDLMFRKSDICRRLKVLEDRQKQLGQTQCHSRQNAAVEREATKKILRGADIVATTLNSCVVKSMETVFPPTGEGKYHFQVCIVDEATQCLEVETLIPLLLGVKTLVLVGDPNQLPATILSKVARDRGLGTSLFARLQNTVPHAVQLLDTQYRMHPEILRWPNKYFYNRRLKTPDAILTCRESRILPYCVLSLPFTQDPRGEVNQDEAKFVLQLAEVVLEKKAVSLQDFKVGIVTPYHNQRRLIQTMLQDRPCRDMLEVNTIDSYQGQERDVIILSCVRTNGVGFLSDRQRINVALTRAKYALFICGNFLSLDRDSMWNNLLSDARQRNVYIDLRSQLQNEDLWKCIRKR